MITEAKPVVENTANTLVPYGAEQQLTVPHCKWCASQGLGHDDDDIFDAHFKTIVAAMRRHEGKITHGSAPITRSGDHGLRSALDLESSDDARPFTFSLSSFTRWGAAQSILALIAIAVIGVNVAGSRQIDKNDFAAVSNDTFGTSTGSIKIKVDKDGANVTGVGTQQHMPAVFWHGGWQDEMALLEGKFDRCNWLKLDNGQLATADGMILYNSHAAEISTVATMRRFRDSVYKYYQAFGKYPETAQDLCQDDSYVNANSHDREAFDIKQVINGAIVSSATSRASISDSRSSAVAGRANAKAPGSIWAVGVKSEPIIADDNNSYNWHNHSFYIYGADSQGHPVKGGVVGKDFTIALKNGADVSETQTAGLDPTNARIGFYTGNKPEVANIRWRYSFLAFTLFLLVVTTVMRVMHSRAGDAQLARLRKGRK